MLKKILILFLMFPILFSGLSVFAYTETYSSSDYGEENWVQEENSYNQKHIKKRGILRFIAHPAA